MWRYYGAAALLGLAAATVGQAQTPVYPPAPSYPSAPVYPPAAAAQPGSAVPSAPGGTDTNPAAPGQKLTAAEKAALEAELLKPYLTPEGLLVSPILVTNEQTGFYGGTFAGMRWVVDPSGAWTVTQIFRRQPTVVGQGVMTKAQLRELALVLANNNALGLPDYGRPYVNPHVISITFGGNRAVMTFGVDQRLPATNPAQREVSISGRYSSIAGAVRSFTEGNNGPGTPLRTMPPPPILNPRQLLTPP